MYGFEDMFDWFVPMMAVSLLVPLIITVLVVGVIVWAIRRSSPPREDPAVAELKARYARGEISPAEFEVRLRSLTQDRD
jgi:uncharacterized membrane protein